MVETLDASTMANASKLGLLFVIGGSLRVTCVDFPSRSAFSLKQARPLLIHIKHLKLFPLDVWIGLLRCSPLIGACLWAGVPKKCDAAQASFIARMVDCERNVRPSER